MKKTTVIALAFIFGVSVANAGLVDWSSGNAKDDSVAANFQAGWLVAIYKDVDGNNDNSVSWFNELRLKDNGLGTVDPIASSDLTSDDELLGFTTVVAVVVPGTVIAINTKELDLADNIDVYTVIFNNADIASAGQFVVTDSSPFNSGSAHAPDVPLLYKAFDTSIAGNFQAIPEPTVAAFIGVFGGGMLIARRLFSKQA